MNGVPDRPCAVAALACILLGTAAFAQPSIVQPGAPGQASRTITAEQSRALAASGYTAGDVRFMQHMMVHHAQAVEMNALIAARTDHPGIRLMGERIAIGQRGEIELMETWLERRGEAPGDHDLHAHHGHRAGHGEPSSVPLMPGMLSPAEMAALRAASGTQFDRLFLTGMIKHHQGAIEMVEALLRESRSGQDTALSGFLGDIVADQSAEIRRMQSMLAELDAGGTSGEDTQ